MSSTSVSSAFSGHTQLELASGSVAGTSHSATTLSDGSRTYTRIVAFAGWLDVFSILRWSVVWPSSVARELPARSIPMSPADAAVAAARAATRTTLAARDATIALLLFCDPPVEGCKIWSTYLG